ncbi:MAG: DUF1805 domain-containing protein [Opitutales bacterium]
MELQINDKVFQGVSVELPVAPLLIIKSDKGFLACGYVQIDTASRLGEVAAIVTGVSDFDDMLNAPIKFLSEKAKATLSLPENPTGKDFLLAL